MLHNPNAASGRGAIAKFHIKRDTTLAFLNKYYASGHFLASGRKIPRDGGIILAMGKDREQIEAIIQEDPFHAHGLADFRVIQFRASQRADDLPKRIIG